MISVTILLTFYLFILPPEFATTSAPGAFETSTPFQHYHVHPVPVLCSCKNGYTAPCRSFVTVVFHPFFPPLK